MELEGLAALVVHGLVTNRQTKTEGRTQGSRGIYRGSRPIASRGKNDYQRPTIRTPHVCRFIAAL